MNRIRRIKCDEAKPSCKRCTSTGRKCDGYGEVKTVSLVESPPATINAGLVLDVSSDPLERRTFDFFRSKTVAGISGYFHDAVWERTVLQVSHSEPTIRFAVNALGALHEEILLRREGRVQGLPIGAECRTSFPMKQYTKAIQGLQRLLESDQVPLDLVLLCSMVFMHFEALHQSFLPALVHLENAIRLLKARQASCGKKVDEGIVQSIMRMDVQGSVYLGMRIPGLPYYQMESPLQSTTIRDLSHARDIVNTSTSRLLHFVRTEADKYKFREVCLFQTAHPTSINALIFPSSLATCRSRSTREHKNFSSLLHDLIRCSMTLCKT